ncbi:hypothetical protein [Alkaliphilus sp. B6464]|uniref:DUF1281 family ferredoxin-like fold protein n=1 Tax=Alkaliphilus sp. B6464 TaxID=2731219 RepID=UPI001BAC437E|nr:hypothetical protein [Alkaliphilus sp. B6464]QUH21933.1 hypothetical protein HYG84_18665 [Alkaliphilus sp. B6464]
MANTIINRLLIKGEKGEVSQFYNFIKKDTEEETFGIGVVDFNKIEPMPNEIMALELENGCAEDRYFEWTNKYWGSKGNACGISNRVNTKNDIWFKTSGGNSKKIVEKLSEMFPNIEIEYSFYDDFDLGSNVGKCIFRNATLLNETKLDNKSKEAFEFILTLEACTPDIKGLIYNFEIDNYEYME